LFFVVVFFLLVVFMNKRGRGGGGVGREEFIKKTSITQTNTLERY